MPNRLAQENSPYLLQHAENPVDWYPWGKEALEKARKEDKPIFLSIGYAACHWCHVMEHESFEDNHTAKIMNKHFVNIKVDREERPDLDNIYMQAVVAMTNQGGWPMSVFLTPDGHPFYGGTYFPPVRRYNMPSFREILDTIKRLWQNDRTRLLNSAQEISNQIQNQATQISKHKPIQAKDLEQVIMTLSQSYDRENGGWGSAPKFPQPMIIEFLLQKSVQDDKYALEMAENALNAMAKGGMYDVVGGGFSRYSVDNYWKIPHFEKMLYDNALLARAYLHAYLITKKPIYRKICEETLDFVFREMTNPEGGFYSSLDADSEGEEGKFYVWTLNEIENLNLERDEKEFLIEAYGITQMGNFEGANVLQRVIEDESLAGKFSIPIQEVPLRLKKIHTHLLESRSHRIRPQTDDKVLVSWNAFMLIAFAEAGRYLKRNDYTAIAIRNVEFILDKMLVEKKLYRSWREGIASHSAYLEDFAGLILGLLSLYQSDPNPKWYATAKNLAEEVILHFSDPKGGFYDTRDDHEELIIRPKDLQDNATPSGNALMVMALLQLSAYSGNGEFRDLAERMLGQINDMAIRYPTAFAQWLCATYISLNPIQEVALLGDLESTEVEQFRHILWSKYRPHLVAAISTFPPNQISPELLSNRRLVNQKSTAYICTNFVCQNPVTNSDDFQKQLEDANEIKRPE